jgi:hypothetical protein
LQGAEGDRINALLAGCGFNLSKLLRAFSVALQSWLAGLIFKVFTRRQRRSYVWVTV